ncbi:MAG TPA: NAD(P)H-dependent oxidoreductase [Pseudonocardiaceae bacterium]|nr:NAD(P)H-dependent oxidoreductase [Pseudonocardiaceae bacterium]
MTQPHLQIVIGSTRPGRRGGAVARWFHDVAVRHDRFDVELIDLVEVGLPLLDEPQPSGRGPYTQGHTQRWSRTISAGQAYVFVVPEYNHSYNAATKNALDYLNEEWRHKPIAFVGYGGAAAGARAVQALIPVVVSLGMKPLARAVHIPRISRAVAADGTLRTDDRLDTGALTLLDELFQLAGGRTPAEHPAVV